MAGRKIRDEAEALASKLPACPLNVDVGADCTEATFPHCHDAQGQWCEEAMGLGDMFEYWCEAGKVKKALFEVKTGLPCQRIPSGRQCYYDCGRYPGVGIEQTTCICDGASWSCSASGGPKSCIGSVDGGAER